MDICLESKLLEIMTDRDFGMLGVHRVLEEPDITERLDNEISIMGAKKMPSSVIPSSCSFNPI